MTILSWKSVFARTGICPAGGGFQIPNPRFQIPNSRFQKLQYSKGFGSSGTLGWGASHVRASHSPLQNPRTRFISNLEFGIWNLDWLLGWGANRVRVSYPCLSLDPAPPRRAAWP